MTTRIIIAFLLLTSSNLFAADRYRCINGNWNAASSWSSTAGHADACAAAVPTSSDDCFFDSNSGTGTVTINTSATCNNFVVSNWTGTLAGSSALAISGTAFTLSATQAALTYTGTITFNSTSGTTNITSAGKSFASAMTFNGVGGTWSLADAMVNTGTGAFTVTNGIFTSNAKALTLAGNISSTNSNTRSIILDNSTVTSNSTGNIIGITTATGLTWSATGATFIISDPSSSVKQIDLQGGNTIPTVSFTGGGTLRQRGGLIPSMTLLHNTDQILQLQSGSGQRVYTVLDISGTAGHLNTLNAQTSGTEANFNYNGTTGYLCLDYMSVQDIGRNESNTIGSIYVGTHSTNVSGNSGIGFSACPTQMGLASFGSGF